MRGRGWPREGRWLATGCLAVWQGTDSGLAGEGLLFGRLRNLLTTLTVICDYPDVKRRRYPDGTVPLPSPVRAAWVLYINGN